MSAGPVRIARLRSAAGHRDPFAVRHRLARELAAEDWSPRGLGAEALLVVRRLRAATGARSTPALRGIPGVRDALHDAASRAARPAQGYVPETAPAVLFADRAELLACLARDARAGRLGAWWWRLVLGTVRGDAAVLEAWLARPAAIAPALAALHASGDAVAFLRAMGTPGTARLAQALVATHALTALLDVATHSPATRTMPPTRDETERATPSDVPRAPAAWAAFAAVGQAHVLPPALALPLVLALALQLAPAEARSPAFAAAVRRWREDAIVPAARRSGRGEATAVAVLASPETRAGEAPARPAPHDSARGAARIAGPASTHSTPPPVPPHVASRSEDTVREVPATAASAEMPRVPRSVDTRYGGAFFLLNAALALNLYGDFTRPRDPGLALSPWDLLALIGPRLARRSFRRDPLDALLAALAGRDARTPPGADFTAPHGTLAQWADATACAVGDRIAEALGMRSRVRAGALVVRLPARVRVGTERLDVTFALAALPIALRLAGLDRDPGWIPAAGRDVRFHFE